MFLTRLGRTDHFGITVIHNRHLLDNQSVVPAARLRRR